MTKDAKNLNGSVKLLADAMKKVFQEGIQGAIEPGRNDMKEVRSDMKGMEARLSDDTKEVRSDMKGMETRLNNDMKGMETRLNTSIGTTNQNMQAQFAKQEEKIGKMFTKR